MIGKLWNYPGSNRVEYKMEKITNSFFYNICRYDLSYKLHIMIHIGNAPATMSPGLGLAHLLSPKTESHRESMTESRPSGSIPVLFPLYHTPLLMFFFQIILILSIFFPEL